MASHLGGKEGGDCVDDRGDEFRFVAVVDSVHANDNGCCGDDRVHEQFGERVEGLENRVREEEPDATEGVWKPGLIVQWLKRFE
ncbi:MAG: hypothetical protein ACJ07L_11990 [Opitutales bacterium]